MSTIAAPNPNVVAPAAPAPATVRGDQRVSRLRSWMLTLVSASVAFGVLAAIVAWQANLTTYSAYHSLVDDGSVSVDAALQARADVLDHMSAGATFLETGGDAQKQSVARAQELWAAFNNQSRISWHNITDPVHGENNVYTAADSAASDYIQQIGAMYSFYNAGQADKAGQSFLAARETLNTRLIPALNGLESVKVEDMEAAYRGAAERITNWRYALVIVGGVLALAQLAGLIAIRRMHYRWSWPIGLAFVATIALTTLMQWQLSQAADDARVMVREAYDNVAGVQDLSALLSQGRALESIVVFDPKNASEHFADFDQYNALVEQELCGPRNCTSRTFLSGPDTIDAGVTKAALDEQSKLGLARTPLVANVHFAGQADRLEALRKAYRQWLDAHQQLQQAVQSSPSQAATLSNGQSASAFDQVASSVNSAGQVARDKFNSIWQRVYTVTGLGQALAAVFLLGGLLAAWGIAVRRRELLI